MRASALLTPTLGYLRQLLQTCVEIEHSTIPLYLTAAWSMDDNKSFAYNVTHGVAIEEMLHMTDAANLLNAIGGAPDIDQPSFVPRYPIVMPIINVSSSIASFSRRTYGTFEKIEVEGPAKTIATTYAYVADVLTQLVAAPGEAAVFPGDPARLVNVTTRGGERTTVVTTLAAAVAALEGISDQGSGCPSPDPPGFNLSAGALGGGLAHFARFKEVLVGREYRTGDTVDSGPTGAAVAVDWRACAALSTTRASRTLTRRARRAPRRALRRQLHEAARRAARRLQRPPRPLHGDRAPDGGPPPPRRRRDGDARPALPAERDDGRRADVAVPGRASSGSSAGGGRGDARLVCRLTSLSTTTPNLEEEAGEVVVHVLLLRSLRLRPRQPDVTASSAAPPPSSPLERELPSSSESRFLRFFFFSFDFFGRPSSASPSRRCFRFRFRSCLRSLRRSRSRSRSRSPSAARRCSRR